MYSQNGEWWRNNFDSIAGIPDNGIIPPSARRIQNDNNFNQYSSFFLEAHTRYHARSHKGDERCENRGNAGSRIENDPSVELDKNDGTGVTLWSLKQEQFHMGTDYRAVPGANGQETPWGANARGLKAANVISLYKPDNIGNGKCSFHSLRDGRRFTGANDYQNDNTLYVNNFNELVTNVLTNAHVRYPHGMNAGVIEERWTPLGGLLIDNLCNHMLAHTSVLVTQRCGFHIHLSEHPIIGDYQARAEVITGFIKLFYLFEPLIFSFFPKYRSSSQYCQSLQSIFTKREIIECGIQLYNDLVMDGGYYVGAFMAGDARNHARVTKGYKKYLSLNLQNCLPGKIGTIEVRLGHSSFDSKFIQAFNHFLQVLLQLNITLIRLGEAQHDKYRYHNLLLSSNLIPYYCKLSSNEYSNNAYVPEHVEATAYADREVHPDHYFRPIFGFFDSCGYTGNDQTYKSHIIRNLFKTYIGLTGAKNTMEILHPYINFFHTSDDYMWLTPRTGMNLINFNTAIEQIQVLCGVANIQEANNIFTPVEIGVNYAYNGDGGVNYQHNCKTCSANEAGVCKRDFNNGNLPNSNGRTRDADREARLRDESELYEKACQEEIAMY